MIVFTVLLLHKLCLDLTNHAISMPISLHKNNLCAKACSAYMMLQEVDFPFLLPNLYIFPRPFNISRPIVFSLCHFLLHYLFSSQSLFLGLVFSFTLIYVLIPRLSLFSPLYLALLLLPYLYLTRRGFGNDWIDCKLFFR